MSEESVNQQWQGCAVLDGGDFINPNDWNPQNASNITPTGNENRCNDQQDNLNQDYDEYDFLNTTGGNVTENVSEFFDNNFPEENMYWNNNTSGNADESQNSGGFESYDFANNADPNNVAGNENIPEAFNGGWSHNARWTQPSSDNTAGFIPMFPNLPFSNAAVGNQPYNPYLNPTAPNIINFNAIFPGNPNLPNPWLQNAGFQNVPQFAPGIPMNLTFSGSTFVDSPFLNTGSFVAPRSCSCQTNDEQAAMAAGLGCGNFGQEQNPVPTSVELDANHAQASSSGQTSTGADYHTMPAMQAQNPEAMAASSNPMHHGPAMANVVPMVETEPANTVDDQFHCNWTQTENPFPNNQGLSGFPGEEHGNVTHSSVSTAFAPNTVSNTVEGNATGDDATMDGAVMEEDLSSEDSDLSSTASGVALDEYFAGTSPQDEVAQSNSNDQGPNGPIPSLPPNPIAGYYPRGDDLLCLLGLMPGVSGTPHTQTAIAKHYSLPDIRSLTRERDATLKAKYGSGFMARFQSVKHLLKQYKGLNLQWVLAVSMKSMGHPVDPGVERWVCRTCDLANLDIDDFYRP